MEMDPGKLFIGGISWETTEERLQAYFQTFGDVLEAVIMKDRTTGRARGFGFVVFADANIAENVVRERHIIDGRTVEAKKAVPRDDHQNFNKIINSPSLPRTKKIFVGGLASTVTETDFKGYFDQFGKVTDVIVMYDHNTQRPRGFGFITYDTEESVDRVLLKTFHELNGKMVEVKRAVPKELSPGPTRIKSGGFNYGLNRMSGFLNAYNLNSPGGYGVKVNDLFSPVSMSRSPINYNMGLNFESRLSLNYGQIQDRGMSSFHNANSNIYSSPVAYDLGNNTNQHVLSIFGGSGIGNGGRNWDSSPFRGRENGSLWRENIGYENGGNSNPGGIPGNIGKNGGILGRTLSYDVTNDFRETGFENLFEGDLFYGDNALCSSSKEIDGSSSFGYGRGKEGANLLPKNSVGYVGDYRGIAA